MAMNPYPSSPVLSLNLGSPRRQVLLLLPLGVLLAGLVILAWATAGPAAAQDAGAKPLQTGGPTTLTITPSAPTRAYGRTVDVSYSVDGGDTAAGVVSGALLRPTRYTGIYTGWNLYLDGDVNGDEPWTFGVLSRYLVPKYATAGASAEREGLPGPVTGLTVTASGEDSVTVSWSAPASGGTPDGYIVHLRPEGGKQGSGTTKRPEAARTTVSFGNLESGQTYKVWVRAQNEAGKGERTHASITLPAVLPGPVAGLELTATADSVTVSWSAPESGGAPDGYIVHIRPEDGGKGSGKTKTPRARKTRVTFGNLEAGQTYRVWVRAQNEAGKGERVHASIILPESEQDEKLSEEPEEQEPEEREPEEPPPTDDGGGQERGEDHAVEPALISNFGQERRLSDWSTNNFVLTQGFTTGNAGATLEGIKVSIRETLHASHVETVRAELWSSAEGGEPESKLVDLVVPGVMERGAVAFTAPANTALSANTAYHFVLYTTGRVDLRVVATYSEDEDAGGEEGWSIADVTHDVKAQTPDGGEWVEVTDSGVMLMRVKGQPVR